jgi:hypothetical protein
MSLRLPDGPETCRHGIVSGIIIPPYFRQATAPLGCDKILLRWPGPFGTGFLSPQPPGVVGIGPVRRIVYPHTGPTKVGPFSFGVLDFPALTFKRSPTTITVIPGHASSAWPCRAIARQGSRNSVLSNDDDGKFSAAAYTPRRASGRACRGCRPGHRRPRHRRRPARCFPAARSSYWDCRSSRRP